MSPHRGIIHTNNAKKTGGATIQDVARESGLSVGTVSRYLNGYKLRSANSIRIAQAIEQLDYRENFIAKGMKTRRTYTIGIAVSAHDEFQVQVIRTLERRLYAKGYTLVICDFEDDLKTLESKLNFFLNRYVDGLVIIPIPRSAASFTPYRERKIPVIFYDVVITGFNTDSVSCDHQNGSRQGAEYLLAMGHRRIGYLGGPAKQNSSASERRKGFELALRNANIPETPGHILDGTWDKESGYANAMKLLTSADPPTALLAANYRLGIGALLAIKKLGLRIPEDVSLVSFDDVDAFEIYQPGITCIKQPVVQIADVIADLMIERLSGKPVDRYQHISLPSELIVRESVRNLLEA